MSWMVVVQADTVIITNDNPRDEDPQKIVDDIIAGIPDEKRSNIIIELDRKKAIKTAVSISKPTSIIALLGKGHESAIVPYTTISIWIVIPGVLNDYWLVHPEAKFC